MTAFPGFCILAVARTGSGGRGTAGRPCTGGGHGPARERLPAASGSASRVRRAGKAARPCVGGASHCFRLRQSAPVDEGRQSQPRGQRPRRTAVLRHRSAASPRRMCGRRVKCDSVPRRVCGQWHCPRDCRIMSVTLFHSQTSYCAEAGRAAFCGTPAAHLPNGNRFGGGIAVRQQGGAKAGAVCARQQAKSGRSPSRPVHGGGLGAYRPRFLFLRRLPASPLSKPHLLQATGDRGNRRPCRKYGLHEESAQPMHGRAAVKQA